MSPRRPPLPDRLRVLMGGRPAGWLWRRPGGALALDYESAYRTDPASTPLSVTLPLGEERHTGRAVRTWVTNLLPDNSDVLNRWGEQFAVSSRSPFALLAHVGADCAGAVQFLPEDAAESGVGELVPINQKGIAARLAELRTDPGAWTPRHAAGQFSLAGAQAKMALRRVGEDWFEAAGAEPTSHILKLPMPGFAHQALNEHLCLRTAALLGIPAAASEVADFDGEQSIVVTRFDRAVTPDGRLVRVHQEDLCQALAEPPSRKYQSDGGPGPVEIAALLRRVLPPARARMALATFVEALALAWALAGTDAHAKNYGLLLASEQVRLAPLYDLNSALPYQVRGPQAPGPGQLDPAAVRLAMAVGGQSRPAEIDADSWRRLAEQLMMSEDLMLELVGRVVQELPDALAAAVEELLRAGFGGGQQTFVEQMLRTTDRSARLCGNALRGRGPRRRS